MGGRLRRRVAPSGADVQAGDAPQAVFLVWFPAGPGVGPGEGAGGGCRLGAGRALRGASKDQGHRATRDGSWKEGFWSLGLLRGLRALLGREGRADVTWG